MRRVFARLMLVVPLALVAAGCGGSSKFDIDLVMDPAAARDETFLQWSAPVTISGETRIALQASRPQVVEHEVIDTVAATQKDLAGTVPDKFKPMPRVILGPANLENGVPIAIRVWPLLNGQIGKPFRIPVEVSRITPGTAVSVAIWPVPLLEERDVETLPVQVPAHATLHVAVGLEPSCWQVQVLPVDMVLSAVDETGTVVQIGSATLRANTPEGRRWVELSLPLDAVAGRKVRFRYAARVNGPVQLQYALPVFAEPRITNAES